MSGTRVPRARPSTSASRAGAPARLARAALLSLGLAAAAAAAEPGTPTEVASRFYAAIHRFDAEGAAALTHGAGSKRLLLALVELSRAFARLEEVVGERFGEEAGRQVGWRSRSRAEALAFLAATDEIEGDRCRVRGADGKVLALLTRVNGQWKMDLAGALHLAEGVEALEREARGATQAVEAVARELRAGRYAGAEEALADFQARATRAAAEAPRPGERAL